MPRISWVSSMSMGVVVGKDRVICRRGCSGLAQQDQDEDQQREGAVAHAAILKRLPGALRSESDGGPQLRVSLSATYLSNTVGATHALTSSPVM